MYEVAAIVDKGNEKKENEDCILINAQVYRESKVILDVEKEHMIAAVADGVGGEPFGEVASFETLQTIAPLFQLEKEEIYEAISPHILNCFERLQEIAQKEPEKQNMATTLSGVVLTEEKIATFNLGNSCCFRFRDGILFKMTKDDSVVQTMIDSGMLQESQRKDAENKNIITKYVSSNGKIFEPAVQSQIVKFLEDDIILICSDGLVDYVSLEEIETILDKEETLQKKARFLVEAANRYAENDNISVILIRRK